MTTVKSLSFVLALLTLLLATGSPDPLLTLFSGAALVFGLNLLWPKTGTPVLLLPFILQWLAVSTKPVQSAMTGYPLISFSERGANLAPAAWFALCGLCCLAIGMRWGSGDKTRNFAKEMQIDSINLSRGFVIKLALFAIFGGHVLEIASGYAGPARQPILMLSTIKLAGLFVFVYWCLSRQKAMGLFAAVVSFEIIYGMTGYYGEFKFTLFILIVAVLAAKPRINFGAMLLGAAAFGFLLSIVVFWSAIKPDYRSFLGSAGSNLSMTARLDYLSNAAFSIDKEKWDDGMEAFISRLSYIDFLAHALVHVPAYEPHSDGAQTLGAIKHILTPRVLFPSKPSVPHDTYVTTQFTGLTFTSAAITSISLGYLGEFYADFGWIGAFIAMLCLGAVLGRGYRFFMEYQGLPTLINVAVATMAIIPFVFFERALIKLLGGGVTLFFACILLQRLVIPRALESISTHRERRQLKQKVSGVYAPRRLSPQQRYPARHGGG